MDIAATTEERRRHLRVPVEGMNCASCVSRVETALNRLPGGEATVDLASETAEIRYNPQTLDPAQAVEVVLQAGYGVRHERFGLKIDGMHCASCVGRVE